MRVKRFNIPIYTGYLTVILCDDLNDVGRRYNLPDLRDYGAITFKEKGKYRSYVVAFDRDYHVGLICHEVIHVKNYIYSDAGIELDRFNDEPEAYLVGWLSDKVYSFLQSANKV